MINVQQIEGRDWMESKKDNMQKLHEKEKRLLEFIRRLGYGEITIRVQDGLPVMVERVKEKVKL